MNAASASPNYRLGSLYAFWTALLLATQEPFSVLAARKLSTPYFIGVTQFALLLSVPLLILSAAGRRDFFALLRDPRSYGKLFFLFIIGLAGLLLYDFGLSTAHPIIVAVILNLSPFWAALVTLIVSGKGLPVSPSTYLLCFVLAFTGAMTVAWSQMEPSTRVLLDQVAHDFWGRTWMYAIPVPIFFALSGTLVGHWFGELEESAAVAANFVVSAAILIPASVALSHDSYSPAFDAQTLSGVFFLMLGTIVASAAGRVYYQIALTKTGNDNGFVTMFFLLIPGLTALISLPLSGWIPDLRFNVDPMFFIGLALITAALFVFSYQALRRARSHDEPLLLNPSALEEKAGYLHGGETAAPSAEV
jgi:drug/metabolite transporter (DMT)-like permease